MRPVIEGAPVEKMAQRLDARTRWSARLPMRSMALFAVLIGCGIWLWAEYDPWVLAYVTPETHEEPLRFLGLSADGTRVVTLSWIGVEYEEEHVWVRDCESLRPLVRLQNVMGQPKRATFSLDGTHVLLLNRHDDLLQVFDASSGRRACLYRGHVEGYPVPEDGNYPFVLYAVFSPDGQRVASWFEGGERRGVHVWEATTGKRLFLLADVAKYRDTVEWSRDGKQLVATQRSGPTAAWDAQTGRRLRVVGPVDEWGRYLVCFRCVDGGIRALVSDLESQQMRVRNRSGTREGVAEYVHGPTRSALTEYSMLSGAGFDRVRSCKFHTGVSLGI